MTDKVKKYCDGIDCSLCNEKEPCIYKIANELQEKLRRKEQECERLKTQVFVMEKTVNEYKQKESGLERVIYEQL